MWKFVVAIVWLCCGVAVANAKEVSSYAVGNWSVGVYTDDQTGQFGSCIASVRYNSGISMQVIVSRNYVWGLGLSSPTWQMRMGDQINLRYRVDRSQWMSALATVIGPQLVSIPMPSNGSVINLFRRGRMMEVMDSQRSYFFYLSGTSRLLASLAACVQANLQTEQVASGPALGNGNVSAPAVASNPPANIAPASRKLEGTRILSNFLLAANIQGAQIVDDAKVPDALKFADAVAVAKDQIGFSLVVPDAQSTADRTMAEISLAVSQKCTGKFTTGSSKDTVQKVLVIDAFAACELPDTSFYLEYAVTPRPQEGQYVIGVLTVNQGGEGSLSQTPHATPILPSEKLIDAAYRASQ
jgi:hypothetical protein